jgi:putative SOS response-associated peptidase YedK
MSVCKVFITRHISTDSGRPRGGYFAQAPLLSLPGERYIARMCSRYSLTSPPEAVRAYFRYDNEAVFPPRYNIAPSQPVAIVRATPKGGRELALVRWGLIPSWVKDPREFRMMINARAETAADKPSFRAAMRHRRCLVPTDGFYEWTGAPGAKRPFLVRPAAGGPMAMAGIYEHWQGADGSEMESMAILTVGANVEMSAVHERMPAILAAEHFDTWLDCGSGSSLEAEVLLKPAPEGLLDLVEVSRRLNNPRNEGPEVQEPAGTATLI